MTTSDTNINHLIINKLTKAQYENIATPSPTELYMVTDEPVDNDIYIATFGTTTYNEILTALDNYKTVIVYDSNRSYYYIRTINSTHCFGSTFGINTDYITVDINNLWFRTSKLLADITLSNVSSIDSSSAVQTALDDKVSKSGDTMTGGLTIVASNPVIREDNTNIISGDFSTTISNDYLVLGNSSEDFSGIAYKRETSGEQRTQLWTKKDGANIWDAQLQLGYHSNGNAYCKFPNTTCVEGQWVPTNISIASDVSLNGSTDLSYTIDVPNDGYEYEAMITFWGTTGNVSGNSIEVQVNSNKLNQRLNICRAITRTSSTATCSGSIILPLTTNRTIYVRRATGFNGTFTAQLKGYRRMGTNA